jgi:hypothetical protein
MEGLARFLRPPRPPAVPGERCEFCTVPIETAHSHVVDIIERKLLCACRPCYLLFEPAGAAQGRFKAVPSRHQRLDGFTLSDAQWDALQVPIRLVFFFHNSREGKVVAFYPGPAGATESLLSLEAWSQIRAADDRLTDLAPDVEAALFYRTPDGRQLAYRVPIDVCYELVGLMRTHWKGFDGGSEAKAALEEFFARLDQRSRGVQTERIS